MSLRDQLLKAGLADKKKLKKAEREAKKAAHESAKKAAKGKNAASRSEQQYKEKLEQQRQRDRELNQQKLEKEREREKVAQIRDIISYHRQNDWDADERYYFVYGHTRIKFLLVTEDQQAKLEKGKLGVITVSLDEDNDQFHLVEAEICEKILLLNPDHVVCYYNQPLPDSSDGASP